MLAATPGAGGLWTLKSWMTAHPEVIRAILRQREPEVRLWEMSPSTECWRLRPSPDHPPGAWRCSLRGRTNAESSRYAGCSGLVPRNALAAGNPPGWVVAFLREVVLSRPGFIAAHGGKGVLTPDATWGSGTHVSETQRVDTEAGVAPAAGCGKSHAGAPQPIVLPSLLRCNACDYPASSFSRPWLPPRRPRKCP